MAEPSDDVKQALALGRLHFLKKDYAQAESYLASVVERKHAFADVYNMLAVVHHERGQLDKAQRALEEALRINPAYTEAALNLAVLYNDTGQYAAGRAMYQQALAHAAQPPGELDRHVKAKLANVYAEAGDVWMCASRAEQAVEDYCRALDLCPGFVDIRVKLAAAFRELGEPDRAIDEYREILERSPRYAPAHVGYGMALQAMGRTAEAIERWEKALELSPGHVVAESCLRAAKAAGGARR